MNVKALKGAVALNFMLTNYMVIILITIFLFLTFKLHCQKLIDNATDHKMATRKILYYAEIDANPFSL